MQRLQDWFYNISVVQKILVFPLGPEFSIYPFYMHECTFLCLSSLYVFYIHVAQPLDSPPALTSWPNDPVLRAWQHQAPDVSDIAHRIVSTATSSPTVHCRGQLWESLFSQRTNVGVARFLCKWWKRVGESGWKHRPCSSGALDTELIGRRLSPLTVTSVICQIKKKKECVWCLDLNKYPDVNHFTVFVWV